MATHSRAQRLKTLRGLEPRHLEQFVADVWQERQGWTTEVTDPGPDEGIDVIGQPPGNPDAKTAVQVKRYQAGNKLRSPDIQQYASIRQQYTDIEGVTVVTTSSFTNAAEALGEKLDMTLIDGEALVRIIEREGANEILDWYAAGKPEDWYHG